VCGGVADDLRGWHPLFGVEKVASIAFDRLQSVLVELGMSSQRGLETLPGFRKGTCAHGCRGGCNLCGAKESASIHVVIFPRGWDE
jgi:hypothetical protein